MAKVPILAGTMAKVPILAGISALVVLARACAAGVVLREHAVVQQEEDCRAVEGYYCPMSGDSTAERYPGGIPCPGDGYFCPGGDELPTL